MPKPSPDDPGFDAEHFARDDAQRARSAHRTMSTGPDPYDPDFVATHNAQPCEPCTRAYHTTHGVNYDLAGRPYWRAVGSQQAARNDPNAYPGGLRQLERELVHEAGILELWTLIGEGHAPPRTPAAAPKPSRGTPQERLAAAYATRGRLWALVGSEELTDRRVKCQLSLAQCRVRRAASESQTKITEAAIEQEGYADPGFVAFLEQVQGEREGLAAAEVELHEIAAELTRERMGMIAGIVSSPANAPTRGLTS